MNWYLLWHMVSPRAQVDGPFHSSAERGRVVSSLYGGNVETAYEINSWKLRSVPSTSSRDET